MAMRNRDGLIVSLEPGEVFVFGSNLAGQHYGGAARQAYEYFGAEWGVGEGLTGQTYAFPSLDERMRPVSTTQLKMSRLNLYRCAEAHQELTFYLTKVGCGVAGFSERRMKRLFASPPENIIPPDDWRRRERITE